MNKIKYIQCRNCNKIYSELDLKYGKWFNNKTGFLCVECNTNNIIIKWSD